MGWRSSKSKSYLWLLNLRKLKIYDMIREVFIYNLTLSMCMDYSLQMILFSVLNVCQVSTQ